MIRWDDLATELVLMAVTAVATWVFGSVTKLRKDLNAAFRKIRELEDELFFDD